jgi:hypothetical protein
MKPIQFVLLACALAAMTKVIHSYQQRRMRTLNFLFWTLLWIGTASIIVFPDSTSFVAHLLGIGRGADLIIYASLLMSYCLIFRIHLMHAHLEQEITELVRAIALGQLTEAVDSRGGDNK